MLCYAMLCYDMLSAGDALYVCDRFNCRVVVLGVDLTWRYSFGREGSGDGEFGHAGCGEGPTSVAALDGELYVTDSWNHRVQVFRADRFGRMQFARSIGGYGNAPGQCNNPFGVAGVRGLLVVSEMKRLQVMTRLGVPLHVLPLSGGLRGMAANEHGVWVAATNQVHVLRLR